MKITEADVEKAAKLANLEVTAEELPGLADELSRIVDYVDQLNKLDTSSVEPTTQVIPGIKHAIRDDRAVARTGSADAGKTVKLFKVPRVITER